MSKTIVFTLLIAMTFLIAGCEDQSPCETLDTGTMCIENSLNEPVKIYIEGDYYKSIMSGEEQCIDGVPSGESEISALGEISNKFYFKTTVVEECRSVSVSF